MHDEPETASVRLHRDGDPSVAFSIRSFEKRVIGHVKPEDEFVRRVETTRLRASA